MKKETIIEIIEKYPKHFSQILNSKKYHAEKQWILNNSNIETDKFAEHIRSALYDETNICEYGNVKKLKSINEGWRFCGHSSVCKCSENNQKVKISEYFDTEENVKRIERMQKTNIEKYGCISPFGNKTVREKSKNTMLEKYEKENYFATSEFKEKIKQINMENYGVTSFKKIHIPKEVLQILDDEENFIEFAKNKSIGEIANLLNVDNSTITYRLKKYDCENIVSSRSSFESEIRNFLLENDIKYESNTRKVINPYELDFYIPDCNFAIECNGDYWHSDIFKNKNYHHEKWKKCYQLNIRLIQIRETDWKLYNSLFKTMILQKAKLIKDNNLNVENYNIKQINSHEAEIFLEENHLQGFCSGKIHLGGFDQDNKLCSVMTFGWASTEENKKIFEIKRWATDDYLTHPDLFIKTFNYVKYLLNFDEIIAFSINDWFSGEEYYLCGFDKKEIIEPSYQYFFNGKWRDCSYLTKEKIKNNYNNNPCVLEMIDSGASEFEIADYLKILRYWDSGKIEWTWKK